MRRRGTEGSEGSPASGSLQSWRTRTGKEAAYQASCRAAQGGTEAGHASSAGGRYTGAQAGTYEGQSCGHTGKEQGRSFHAGSRRQRVGASPLIPINQAIVIRGLRAWGRIKSTAAEQRELWRDVGAALAFGRALHPSNQAFGTWCDQEGFGDIDRRCRADAMWLASLSNDWTTTSSHPTAIRAEFNAQQAGTPPSPSLTIEAPTRLTASIEQVAPQAKRINKLVSLAERGEGQEREAASLSDPTANARKGLTWG